MNSIHELNAETRFSTVYHAPRNLTVHGVNGENERRDDRADVRFLHSTVIHPPRYRVLFVRVPTRRHTVT